jgi:hypothetical protein
MTSRVMIVDDEESLRAAVGNHLGLDAGGSS